MCNRFIKFIPSKEALFLLTKKGHAFRLLTIIAESARRYEGDPDGLKIGECEIGGHKNYDMTERNYRTAKDILILRRHIEIVETCRTRKKSTTGTTTVKTKVKLLSSNVYDINFQGGDDRSDDRPTTDRRPTDDRSLENDESHTYSKKDKKDKNIKKINKKETLGASLLAKFYFSLKSAFPDLNEKNLKTTNSQIDAMDRLLKIHSADFIQEVFAYAIADNFWSGVVHSGISLEKNFDKINMQRAKAKSHERTNQPVGQLAKPPEPRFQPSRVLRGNNTG